MKKKKAKQSKPRIQIICYIGFCERPKIDDAYGIMGDIADAVKENPDAEHDVVWMKHHNILFGEGDIFVLFRRLTKHKASLTSIRKALKEAMDD